jgi:hypothetical protein
MQSGRILRWGTCLQRSSVNVLPQMRLKMSGLLGFIKHSLYFFLPNTAIIPNTILKFNTINYILYSLLYSHNSKNIK